MLKPYARSTLNRKYRATGIDAALIALVQDYIRACANFYYLLELEEAWDIISKRVRISRDQFDALIPIFCRDDSLDCYIVPESEIYVDGSDEMFIISILYMLERNEECDFDLFVDSLDDPDSYHGPLPLVEDWDKLDPLYTQRMGKAIFVPDNLLEYADEDYYEETPQTEAMECFLREHIRKPADALDIDEEEYVNNAVWSSMGEMIDRIRDITASPSDNMRRSIEELESVGMPRLSLEETQRFLDLYQDLNNHTRLPVNKGHTPEELYALSRPAKAPKVPGPNDPCPCGSGKKYKKCCGRA